MNAPTVEVTQLLAAAGEGDPSALDRVLPLIYADLREQAERFLRRERSDHTLQATALVHEAYMRLVDQTRVSWQNRAHFFAVAATAMRRILVNHARDRKRLKRGGGAARVALEESAIVGPEDDVDYLALDEALRRLAALDPRKAQVVELRFFAGLEIEEVAVLLEIGEATVKRDWAMAKAWLMKALAEDAAPDGGASAADGPEP